MDADRKRQLQEFVAYAKTLDGDEKGEAQVFLDRLFRAFSRAGYKEAGATLEMRLKNDRGGTAFADLIWKPVVLIEMKKRGEDLSRHLTQAFDYWVRSVPNRPRYVVLCNFDQFRIYDFDQDINQPQDSVTLDELPDRYGPLNFLWPTNERPVFRVDREKVTREAADLLAAVYKRIKGRRDVGPEKAQRFVLQTLIALFSEDIGLLPKHFFTQLLEDCKDPPKTFDLLDGLFRAMNAPKGTTAGRYKSVSYFNGGIFSESAAVELDPLHEVAILKLAASYNWAEVSPDIFGTIFQHSMDAEDRHALGAHYTSPTDIMKIVRPTIVQPWMAFIEAADSPADIRSLQQRLMNFRVLDPACGSGNFLYIAYRELKRVEAALFEKLRQLNPRARVEREFGVVTSRQFYGMDIIPFAVELAKVTMTLAHKLAIDELHIDEKALPLDNLDTNILCKDALINPDGSRADWPRADVIIGNPPFLGAKRLKPERGADYVNAIRKTYPDVPGMADYCVYWFRRAHEHLEFATPEDPFRGRAGLVGTQNIRNNQSRVGGLDYIAKSGTIVEAVENQPWSGEANVHVAIANWVKHPTPTTKSGRIAIDLEASLRLPLRRRLWSKIESTPPLFSGKADDATVARGKRGHPRKDKSYELALRETDTINSALSDTVDASAARVLACNERPQRVFQGITPGHEGFVLSPSEAKALVARDPNSKPVIHPYLIGREIVSGDGRPERYLIDFQPKDQIQAAAHKLAFRRVEEQVLPTRMAATEHGKDAEGNQRSHHKQFLERWWRLAWERGDMLTAFKPLRTRFIACSRVTKRPIFVFISKSIRPGDALQTFAFDDNYSFGILQSSAHWRWFVVKCSKLKSDFRYTPESVFDTFPWPQSPTRAQVLTVAKAVRSIFKARANALKSLPGGLRALYRTLELPGKSDLKTAHAELDAAVIDAYGFNPRKDLLAQLLDLNLSVAAATDRGDRVTAPGVPPTFKNPSALITSDCIAPHPLVSRRRS